ncbi:LCP family protein [Haloglycomyces albus]|uniref:LCP family protein n=1 Tax=Haloglycomyces albus TaxID=526067 RepID=UPI00046D0E51|nr:LCP family protein [Haloglycomyces albus]
MVRAQRSPWWAHALVWVGAVTFLLAGTTAALTHLTDSLVEETIPDENFLGDDRAEMDTENISGPLNFLVVGRDKDENGVTRTDTLIIVHINAELDTASMISVPRDLWIEIADCGNGSPCVDKINSAATKFSEEKRQVQNITDTLYNLTGLRFNGLAIANFEGFLDLIEVVGEVELCPWHEITTDHTGQTFPGECRYYGKDDALEIVRERKAWSEPEDYREGRGGDYGRQAMQQQAIMSILKEAKKQGYHTNPGKAIEILEEIGENLVFDRGGMKLTDLILSLSDIDPDGIQRVRIPSTTSSVMVNGNPTSIEIMSEEQGHVETADNLWRSVENDTVDEWIGDNPEWVHS